jgi:hypothetical protein
MGKPNHASCGTKCHFGRGWPIRSTSAKELKNARIPHPPHSVGRIQDPTRRTSKKFGLLVATQVRVRVISLFLALGRKQTDSSLPADGLTHGSLPILIDVGGGNAKDSKKHALSNIPLRWMIREVRDARCEDIFDPAALKQWHIPPVETIQRPFKMREVSNSTVVEDTLPGKVTIEEVGFLDAPKGKEDSDTLQAGFGNRVEDAQTFSIDVSQDAHDAVKKIRDELKKNPFWWILEVVPSYYRSQNQHHEWVGRVR